MRALTRQSAASQGGGGLRGMINGTKVAEDKSSSLTLAHAHWNAMPLVSATRLVGFRSPIDRIAGFGINRAMRLRGNLLAGHLAQLGERAQARDTDGTLSGKTRQQTGEMAKVTA